MPVPATYLLTLLVGSEAWVLGIPQAPWVILLCSKFGNHHHKFVGD